jgi:hypothetical protein
MCGKSIEESGKTLYNGHKKIIKQLLSQDFLCQNVHISHTKNNALRNTDSVSAIIPLLGAKCWLVEELRVGHD